MGRSGSAGGGVLRTMVAGAGAGATAAITLAGAPGSVTTTSSPGSVGRSTGGKVTLAPAFVRRLPSPSAARLGRSSPQINPHARAANAMSRKYLIGCLYEFLGIQKQYTRSPGSFKTRVEERNS